MDCGYPVSVRAHREEKQFALTRENQVKTQTVTLGSCSLAHAHASACVTDRVLFKL